MNGEFDLMLSIQRRTIEDVDAVIDEIVMIPGVERAKSMIALRDQVRISPHQPFGP